MNRTLLDLKRYLEMLKNLRYDLRKTIDYEMYRGAGNIAVRSYNAIHQGLLRLVDDPFIEAMILELDETTTETERVWMVKLASGQLIGYVEGLVVLVEAGETLTLRTPDDSASSSVRRALNDQQE